MMINLNFHVLFKKVIQHAWMHVYGKTLIKRIENKYKILLKQNETPVCSTKI